MQFWFMSLTLLMSQSHVVGLRNTGWIIMAKSHTLAVKCFTAQFADKASIFHIHIFLNEYALSYFAYEIVWNPQSITSPSVFFVILLKMLFQSAKSLTFDHLCCWKIMAVPVKAGAERSFPSPRAGRALRAALRQGRVGMTSGILRDFSPKFWVNFITTEACSKPGNHGFQGNHPQINGRTIQVNGILWFTEKIGTFSELTMLGIRHLQQLVTNI